MQRTVRLLENLDNLFLENGQLRQELIALAAENDEGRLAQQHTLVVDFLVFRRENPYGRHGYFRQNVVQPITFRADDGLHHPFPAVIVGQRHGEKSRVGEAIPRILPPGFVNARDFRYLKQQIQRGIVQAIVRRATSPSNETQ